ncbi:MAG TPA: PfkB family carbohydrate kinase [Chloroflexota bacterium]
MITIEPRNAASNGNGHSHRSKVLGLEELALHLRGLKAAGKRIAHCHGVFDLLHPGHVRHLAEAKRMGDVLVVTLTPDRFVNKGPHRPAFTEALRAEVLAALDMVDFVAVNRWPTAVEAISMLCPDVYVKGKDYQESSQDVTGGILREMQAVEAVGGRIQFTDDITFSSSNLINRYFPAYSPEVNQYLQAFRERHSADEIKDALASLAELRVVVVGEAILDEYVYCSPLNKSGKEPILAMQHQSKEMYAGGSLAIANHLASFCRDVQLVSYIGERDSHEGFIRDHLKPEVEPIFIQKTGSPTVLKRRYVENYSLTKLFEVYDINDEPLADDEDRRVCGAIEQRLAGCDLAVVADFGHGLISSAAARLLEHQAPFLAVNAQTNAANMGFHTISNYHRADYVCIQERELRLDYRSRNEDVNTLVANLAEQMDGPTILVTQGNQGSTTYRPGEGHVQSPALALKVVDRIGAGDAVLSVTSLCAARNLSADVISFIGNVVGAEAVTIVGNSAAVDRAAIFKTIDSLLK